MYIDPQTMLVILLVVIIVILFAYLAGYVSAVRATRHRCHL